MHGHLPFLIHFYSNLGLYWLDYNTCRLRQTPLILVKTIENTAFLEYTERDDYGQSVVCEQFLVPPHTDMQNITGVMNNGMKAQEITQGIAQDESSKTSSRTKTIFCTVLHYKRSSFYQSDFCNSWHLLSCLAVIVLLCMLHHSIHHTNHSHLVCTSLPLRGADHSIGSL